MNQVEHTFTNSIGLFHTRLAEAGYRIETLNTVPGPKFTDVKEIKTVQFIGHGKWCLGVIQELKNGGYNVFLLANDENDIHADIESIKARVS